MQSFLFFLFYQNKITVLIASHWKVACEIIFCSWSHTHTIIEKRNESLSHSG